MQTHLSCCAKDEAARMPRPASCAPYTLHFAFQFILLMFLCCCCSRRCCVALPCFVSKDFALVCIKISLCCLPPLKTAMPECRCQKRGGKRVWRAVGSAFSPTQQASVSRNSGFYINFPRFSRQSCICCNYIVMLDPAHCTGSINWAAGERGRGISLSKHACTRLPNRRITTQK